VSVAGQQYRAGPSVPSVFEDETDAHREAARFLTSDMNVVPIVRGIDDLGRMNAWLQVAREMDCRRRVYRALEARRDYLVEQERGGSGG